MEYPRSEDDQKVWKILAYTMHQRIPIALLQETHLSAHTAMRLRGVWLGESVVSSYLSYARGIAILVRRSLQWQTVDAYLDLGGRYTILNGVAIGRKVTIAVIYGPNVDTPDVFLQIWHRIMSNGTTGVVWGGDYNVVLELMMDSSSAARRQRSYRSLLMTTW